MSTRTNGANLTAENSRIRTALPVRSAEASSSEEPCAVVPPDVKTRKRKFLRPNSLAGWELRLGDFRVFYDIVPEENTVYVVAIGIKKRNLLFIGGERFVLS